MSIRVAIPRWRRRALLAATLTLVGVPLVTSSGAEAAECVADQGCVVVRIVSTKDGTPKILKEQSFSAADIAAMPDQLENPEYYTRKHKNGVNSESPRPPLAFPLHSLLALVKGDLKDDATFSEAASSGLPSVLSQEELADPKGNEDYPFLDKLPPAVYESGNSIGYVRPQRSEDDINVADQFIIGPGQTLTLTFHTTGKLLEPVVKVAPTSVDTKAKNSFTTSIDSAGTRIVKHVWSFGDGTTRGTKRSNPIHQYKKKGTYPVFVQVRGADGSYGRSAAVEMKVNNPPKPPPTPETGNGGGTGTGTGSGTGGGSSGGYIPPYLPTTPPVVDPPAEQTPPPKDEQPQTPVDDGLEPVEGFVLAGAGADEGDSIPGTQSASQPTQADELSTSRKISGAVFGALAVILLLGLGAEIETRWVSTRLGHLRRRT